MTADLTTLTSSQQIARMALVEAVCGHLVRKGIELAVLKGSLDGPGQEMLHAAVAKLRQLGDGRAYQSSPAARLLQKTILLHAAAPAVVAVKSGTTSPVDEGEIAVLSLALHEDLTLEVATQRLGALWASEIGDLPTDDADLASVRGVYLLTGLCGARTGFSSYPALNLDDILDLRHAECLFRLAVGERDLLVIVDPLLEMATDNRVFSRMTQLGPSERQIALLKMMEKMVGVLPDDLTDLEKESVPGLIGAALKVMVRLYFQQLGSRSFLERYDASLCENPDFSPLCFDYPYFPLALLRLCRRGVDLNSARKILGQVLVSHVEFYERVLSYLEFLIEESDKPLSGINRPLTAKEFVAFLKALCRDPYRYAGDDKRGAKSGFRYRGLFINPMGGPAMISSDIEKDKAQLRADLAQWVVRVR